MAQNNIRKNDSLGTSAAQLHSDFKESHTRYNDLVSELALLTKSELSPIIKSLKEKPSINGIKDKVDNVFDQLEHVLFELEGTHSDMDETVQVVGGLEFATDNTVDKLSQILKDVETQQARMTKEINHLRSFTSTELDSDKIDIKALLEDIEEFQLEFSRFQDYVIDTVPRISKLFDELDKEEEKGIKFGKTNKI